MRHCVSVCFLLATLLAMGVSLAATDTDTLTVTATVTSSARIVSVGDISFDKPSGSGPSIVYLPQCGMTSPESPESVRAVRELRLVECFQQQAESTVLEYLQANRPWKKTR